MSEPPAPLVGDRQVLGPLHLRVLEVVAAVEREYEGELGLRLEGGTALAAYHLRHRESADLDVFAALGFNALDFAFRLDERLHGLGLRVTRPGPWNEGFAELVVAAPQVGVRPLRVQLARSSPSQLAPSVLAAEGVRVASYRDLCAGKFHAICDRFEPRDFIDLHAILHEPLTGPPIPEATLRDRFRALIRDLTASDAGLTLPVIGPCLERGTRGRLVSGFPLALLVPIRDDEVAATVTLCCDELARMVAAEWQRRGPRT